MKRLKLYTIAALFLPFLFLGCNNKHPKNLSDRVETLDLVYIRWACECPRFAETELIKTLEGGELAEACFYIEAAKGVKEIPESYYMRDHSTHYLRLTGSFYLDEGVPKGYEPITSETPQLAKVFRYNKFELVENK